MMGRTHQGTGVTLWTLALPALDAWLGLSVEQELMGAAIAFTLPLGADIDHPQSTAARAFGPFREVVAGGVAKVAGGHRGGTHSLTLTLVLAVVAWWWAPWLGTAVAIGWFGGILGDLFTEQGVALFWPWKQHVRVARLRTNSWHEHVFNAVQLWLLAAASGVHLGAWEWSDFPTAANFIYSTLTG